MFWTVFWTILVPLLVYWLVFFTIHFMIVEYGQNYLYDEPTPSTGLKVTIGSFIAAVAATYFQPSFDTMFTTYLQWSALQALLWFGIFTLIYQFHPQHGLGLSLATFMLFPGLTSMAVDGITRGSPAAAQTKLTEPGKAVRRSAPAGAPAPAAPDPAKEKDAVKK